MGLDDWRDYLRFRAIRNFVPCGPQALVEENFNFQGRTLAGAPQLTERWVRCVEACNIALGHAISKVFLARYFPPAAKAQVVAMTANIKAAMGRRIAALDWMAPTTKQRALAKLANARIDVGSEVPERDFTALAVVPGDSYGNLLRAARFDHARNIAKLAGPVNRGDWQMTSQTVNAQANPTLVKIMFPAGIMQPVFFDPAADPAVNYGAIGVVMGHELSHLFDDQGAKFDENGALNNWWTPDDLAHFKASTEKLAAQYDTYEPALGAHINGHLTLGENIADLAGLNLALDAYHTSLGGKPAPVLAGLTGDQRLFMGFAQVYRTLQRDAYARQAVITDPHSPGEFRAATVRNVDAWYVAFNVQPGQKMYLAPEARVKIW